MMTFPPPYFTIYLQVEKDNLAWRERELYIKNELADVFERSVAASDCRVADIRTEIQKKIEQRNVIENKLKEEAREPGWQFPPLLCKTCYPITFFVYE